MAGGEADHVRDRDDQPAESMEESAGAAAPAVTRAEFLRRRRRSNRLLALVLAGFCAIVFVWIMVRMGAG